MPDPSGAKASSTDLALAGVVAVVLTAGFHLAFARQGINLADEGFLLYGVQRVLAGEVPLRDFQAYEPARYYWCAAWCAVKGDGFLALRGALAAFQAVGLYCGLLVARRAFADRRLMFPIGLVLLAWMFPRYRVFESGLAMMAVLAALLLIERPSLGRHFLVGGFTGLSACFGRNLGLYSAVGTGALVLALALHVREGRGAVLARRTAVWCLGILIGFSPLLGMMAFVPGFARSLLDSILFFAEQGSNNPLPYPWPWRLGHETLSTLERMAVGCAFLLPVLVYPVGIVTGFFTPAGKLDRRAALIAASFVGAGFAHQASVRSDIFHLAGCIHPALLATLAVPRAFGFERRAIPILIASGLLMVMTLLATLGTNPLLNHLRPGSKQRPPVTRTIAGDELRLEPVTAAHVDKIQQVFDDHVPSGERYVFMAPTYPALYPILDKLSPTWGIYFLWPGSLESQTRILRDLEAKNVRWMFIVEAPIDNRPELRFQNSHPLVWRYVLDHCERIPTPTLPTNHFLFRRRAGS